MNKVKLMDKYANGDSLSNNELIFLEYSLSILINEAILSDNRPPVASDKICNYLGLRQESFEMNCIASILDKVKPIDNGI